MTSDEKPYRTNLAPQKPEHSVLYGFQAAPGAETDAAA